MYSYVEKLEIIRHSNREKLQELVNDFSTGKCIKRVTYYINYSNSYITEKHQAYVYYTLPKEPTITITGTLIDGTATLQLTISSDLNIQLTELGVYYNTTGLFSNRTPKVIVNPVYGTQTIVISDLSTEATYFFKPYFKCCLGKLYGEVLVIGELLFILDTYDEGLLDTYGEVILDTY